MDVPFAVGDDRVYELAAAWGVLDQYYDIFGNLRRTPASTCRTFLAAMGCDPSNPQPPPPSPVIVARAGAPAPGPGELTLEDGAVLAIEDRFPQDLPIGYHRFRLRDRDVSQPVIARPEKCHLPPELKVWGWAAQLYATRSEQSWGIGDLADLRRLGQWSAELGAGMVLLNPLCAAAPVKPQQPSPYYPASRCFRNPLYINVPATPGAATAGIDLEQLAVAGRALNQGPRIDRDAIFDLKMAALEQIWSKQPDNPELDRYRQRRGALVTTFARYCTLAERFGADWRTWPAEYRHPESPAAVEFTREHEARVRFHEWLQWVLDRQLAQAAKEIPLVHDLPIGCDPGGADAWAWQDILALNASVGAPPDAFNAAGQNWGLPPFAPQRLQAAAYQPFIEVLRSTFEHGGGVRIDHVMGLFRLYWIPVDASAHSGTYVRYPADELLAILAVESHRAGAWVAGEDLGTVEPAVRERLAAEDILSHRLLWFEDAPPAAYPWRSIAAVTTHDLPTIAGLWTGADFAAQQSIGLTADERGYHEMRQRIRGMTNLPENATPEEAILAAHRLLGQSPSAVVVAALTDALAVQERPNMPGTVDEWPNWSLPLPLPLEQITAHANPRRIAEALRRT
jgi:4-alpha-glucanotransferase